MSSFPKCHIGRLSLVALAASAGVWSEIQAMPAPAAPLPFSRSMDVVASDGSAFALVYENGDGTAETFVLAALSPTEQIGTVSFANEDYSITTALQPGQSVHSGGTGNAEFGTVAYIMDWSTFMSTGPFEAYVELAVTGTTDVNSYVRQGVRSEANLSTGEILVVREHVVGNEAFGQTAGSISIWLDNTLVKEDTGGMGLVRNSNIHRHERIR